MQRELAELIQTRTKRPNALTAEVVLRRAGFDVRDRDISPDAARWLVDFMQLIVESGTDSSTFDEAFSMLREHVAPQVLALIKPGLKLPECRADEVARICRRHVRDELQPLSDMLAQALHESAEVAALDDEPENGGVSSDPDDEYTAMADRNRVPWDHRD